MITNEEEVRISQSWREMDLETKTKLCMVVTRCHMSEVSRGKTSVPRSLFREFGKGNVSDTLLETFAQLGIITINDTYVDFVSTEVMDQILRFRNEIPKLSQQ